jgi:tetratricopeptide (TPR) repeat protein
MQARFTRLAVVVVALSAAVAGCGKYSISNIRSAKAFQDANVLYTKSDWAGAAARYEDAITFNPNLGFAYFFLGHSHEQQFKPAKRADPANMAHLQEAAKYYRTAVEKMKDSTDPKEQMVRRYAYEYLIAIYGHDKLDDFAQAEPVARELIALDPGDPSTYRILATLYEEQGRMDEAEREFLKAVDVKPNDPVGYQMLAGYYQKQGNFPKMMETWYKRAQAEPKNPEAWHTIGSYYQAQVFGDKKLPRNTALEYVLKGLEAEDKALALSPDYFEAVSYKNILLRNQALYEKDPAKIKKLIEEADEYYKRAMDLKKKADGGITTTPKPTIGKGK